MPEAIEANRSRVASLYVVVVAVPTLVLGVIGVVTGLVWWGLLVGIVIGAALILRARRDVEGAVLRAVGARRADEVDFRRYHNLVEGLCVTSGLPKPSLWIVDDQAANALATARTSQQSSVVVTTGLLEQLPRIELEGVVASLLGQIRSGDAAASSAVAMLVAPLAPLGGAAGALARRFVDPGRQTRHDVAACRITRYPPGMIAALDRLARHDTRPQRHPGPLAHLWLIPTEPTPDTPTLDERIAMLREL